MGTPDQTSHCITPHDGSIAYRAERRRLVQRIRQGMLRKTFSAVIPGIFQPFGTLHASPVLFAFALPQ